MIEGVLTINGQAVKRERLEDFEEIDESNRNVKVKRWRETLPNGVSYTTLDLIDNGFYDNTPVYTVPPDHYWRQPRQLHRQPRVVPGRLRAVHQHRRSRADHLLLDRRR
jgi:hypothetical protein